MVPETLRLADQLALAFEGGAWHGPSLGEVLRGVSAPVAAAHPVPGAHSIWELALHLHQVQDLVRRRLEGDPVPFEESTAWPPQPGEPSPEKWDAVVALITAGERRLREVVLGMNPARLDDFAMPGGDTIFVTIQGHLQHNLWHAGQMALLRRAAEARMDPGGEGEGEGEI